MTNQSRTFHLSDVLSITTHRLVSTRHMAGVRDILNYMTGDDLFEHQIPRAVDACTPALLEQYPQLQKIDASCVDNQNWRAWLAEQVQLLGETLEVRPLTRGQYKHQDPIEEAERLVGKGRVLVVVDIDDKKSSSVPN